MAEEHPQRQMGADARPAAEARRSGGAAVLPIAFITTALIALAVTPSLLTLRTSAIRAQVEDVLEPARDELNELQIALALQLSAQRGYILSGDPRYLRTYRTAREDEREALEGLRELPPELGPQVAAAQAQLESVLSMWHGRQTDEEMLAGTLEPAVYTARLPTEQAVWESLLEATSLLSDELGEREEDYRDQSEAAEQVARVLTIFLVLLALMAVVTVVRLGLRMGALTEETDLRRREAEGIMEDKARLIRGFGHNLKNPLGAIQGYAELLEEGVLNGLNDKQKDAIGRIRTSLTASLSLVDELVDLSRAEAGQLEIKREPTAVPELLSSASEASRAAAENAGLRLEVDMPDDMPTINTDPRLVRQVVGNLLSNAIKYTPEGGTVTVRARTEAPAKWGRHPTGIAIDVSDTGPGIPPEEQEHVFQEFSRGRTEGKGGSGLGLAISRNVARLLDGDLTVYSEPDIGATFTLHLPLNGGSRD